MRIGLIGAGLLGGALARRFLASGFEVTAFDTSSHSLQRVEALGAHTVASAAAAAAGNQYIVLCLPDSKIASTVLKEVAPALTPQQIVVDTTTGAPEEMEAMAALVPHYVDATIAGSSRQVADCDAVVMAGGHPVDVDSCSPLFRTFAKRTFHVGPHGAGARMKLVVNLVLGLNRAATAEGLAFADSMGIDLQLALEVLQSGPARSTAMDRKGAKMVSRDWTPEARLRQHHKDVQLILAEAERTGIHLPLSTAHQQLLNQAEQAGFANADNSAIFEAFLKQRRK